MFCREDGRWPIGLSMRGSIMRSWNEWLCRVMLLALAGCAGEEVLRTARPPAAESSVGLVKLTAKAQQQIGLECQRPAKRGVQAVLSLTGWLELPPGKEVVVGLEKVSGSVSRRKAAIWFLTPFLSQAGEICIPTAGANHVPNTIGPDPFSFSTKKRDLPFSFSDLTPFHSPWLTRP